MNILLALLLWLIDHLFRWSPERTATVAITFGGSMSLGSGSVVAGKTTTASLVPLEADGTTPTPGATVSSATFEVDNTAIATVKVNADGTATVTGVAAGSAVLSVTCTVIDADGTSQNFTATGTVTVTAAPPPPARTASVAIAFA